MLQLQELNKELEIYGLLTEVDKVRVDLQAAVAIVGGDFNTPACRSVCEGGTRSSLQDWCTEKGFELVFRDNWTIDNFAICKFNSELKPTILNKKRILGGAGSDHSAIHVELQVAKRYREDVARMPSSPYPGWQVDYWACNWCKLKGELMDTSANYQEMRFLHGIHTLL